MRPAAANEVLVMSWEIPGAPEAAWRFLEIRDSRGHSLASQDYGILGTPSSSSSSKQWQEPGVSVSVESPDAKPELQPVGRRNSVRQAELERFAGHCRPSDAHGPNLC
jgi:hypothetical protein